MAHADALRTGLTWVAYPHPKRGHRTRNAHAVEHWDPREASVATICGRTLELSYRLSHGTVTLVPNGDRPRCGYCVLRLERTNPAAVSDYLPRRTTAPASAVIGAERTSSIP